MVAQWSFLTPWWRALQNHELFVLSRRSDFREELHGLSVSVDPRADLNHAPFRKSTEEERIQAFTALRDSIEIALLLAIVDRREFNSVINANMDNEERRVDTENVLKFHPNEIPSHVELRFDKGCVNDPVVLGFAETALSIFITPQRLEDRAPAFQVARHQIFAQIRPSEFAKRWACERLRITVGVTHNHVISPLKLMELLDAVELQTAPTYPFVAAGFTLNVRQNVFTPSALPLIEAWQRRSRPFDQIFIPYEPNYPLAQFGRALSAAIQPKSSAEVPTTGNTAHVSVYGIHDHARFVQVFSALMHTRRIHSLSISMKMLELASKQDHRRHLRWFIFALFSRWATHSIKHLHVDSIKITDEEVEDLRDFSRSENPLPLLFDNRELSETVNPRAKQVLARENAQLQLDLSHRRRQAGEPDFIVLAEESWLDVISEDTESEGGWFVLVPAYGKGRLRRTHLKCASWCQVRRAAVYNAGVV